MYEKIEESELKRRSLKNVSTTPTRRTPFGESGLSAEQLKERFDLLSVYIANRLNEVFEGMENGEFIDSAKFVDGRGLGEIIRSLYDGSGAHDINIETPTEKLTLAEAVNKLVRLLDEIENGELTQVLNAVPDMSALDVMMFEKFGTGEGEYFFSQANWDDLQRYNRAYVQCYDEDDDLRLGENGKGLYALKAICRYGAGTVPRYPWLKKSVWAARYREKNPDTTLSDEQIITQHPPTDTEYGDMATIIERQPNGFIKVPTGFPTDKTEAQMEGYAVPKKYVDKIKVTAEAAVKKIDCPDKNRYVYTTSQNAAGVSIVSLIKTGANVPSSAEDLNGQPLVRRRVNGAVSTRKIPEADDDAASKYFVVTEIAKIVGSAPETLNALNELAEALGNDPNFAATVANQIGSKAAQAELDALSTAVSAGLAEILEKQNEILGGAG